MKIETKLNRWLENNFITGEQKQKILDYEAARAAGNNWVFYGLLILGAIAVAVGVISLIAYNWADIPAGAKLISGAVLLCALAWGYIYCGARGHNALAEVCLFVLFGLVLGYIGLTAQVFNLHSASHRGFLFWVIITTPLAFTAKRAFVPFAWTMALFIVLPFELAQYKQIEQFFRILFQDVKPVPAALGGLAFAGMLWQALPRLLGRLPNIAFSARFLSGLGVSAALFGVVTADFFFTSGYFFRYSAPQINVLFLILTASCLAVAALLAAKENRRIFEALAAVIFAGAVFYSMIILGALAGLLYFLLFYVMAAVYFDMERRKYLCNFFILLAGIRIIRAYAAMSDSLLGFGVSMITSGILSIGLILLWHKYSKTARERMAAFFKGGAK
jgi:hypothetical protein